MLSGNKQSEIRERSCSGNRRRRRAAFLIFGLWAVLVSVPMAYLLANHLVPIPGPRSASKSVATQLQVDGSWRAIHFLAPDCGCSLSIARYLNARGRVDGLEETVLLMDAASELEPVVGSSGFAIEFSSATEIEHRFGIKGGPWLLLLNPAGEIVYSGGYVPVRAHAGVRFQDLAIWERCRAGEPVAALPAFGCASSASLREVLDPFHLKYTR